MRVHTVENRGFYARVGDFFGPLRPTANQALEALEQALEAYHPLSHHYVRCVDGTVIHVYQMPAHGWNAYIIPSAGPIREGKGLQAPTAAEAIRQAEQLATERFGGVR